MYTDYFKLTRRPFSRVPTAESCVMFPALKASFDRACECIDDFAGPVLVVGGSGCGKSTFLAVLEKHYQVKQLATVNLNCAAITCRQELIQCLLFELGQPFTSDNVGELRLKLIDHLKSDVHCPNGMLLLVDEAQNMSVDVLEELRMITNLICGSQQQIRLVVAGTRSLEETLLNPKMESFNQRISARCYLQPMTRTETMYYALAQMEACGRDGRDIFRPSALDRVYDITDGVPRLAAQLCDHVLKRAAQDQLTTIDSAMVQKAWANLQQLPMEEEVIGFAGEESSAGIIEFGSLDDGQSSSFDATFGAFEASPESHSDPLQPPKETVVEPIGESNEETSGFDHNEAAHEQNAADEDVGEGVVNIDSYREETAEQATPSLMRFPESDDDGDEEDEQEMPELEDAAPRVDSTLDQLLAQMDEIENPAEPSLSIADTSEEEMVSEDLASEPAFAAPKETGSHSEIADMSSVVADGLQESDANLAGLAKMDPNDLKSLAEAIASAHAMSDLQYEKEQAEIAQRVDLQDEARLQNSSRVEPSAEDLFGEAFDDEEPVDEIENAALANQNRISSGLTSEELSNLSPVEELSGELLSEPDDEEEPLASQSFITPSFEEESRSRETVAEASPVGAQTVEESVAPFDEVTLSEESRAESAAFQQPASQPSFVTPVIKQSNEAAEEVATGDFPVDDSDMLISAPAEQEQIKAEPEPQAVEVAAEEKPAETSAQGQVIRMNYQELFQQLRQTPGSES